MNYITTECFSETQKIEVNWDEWKMVWNRISHIANDAFRPNDRENGLTGICDVRTRVPMSWEVRGLSLRGSWPVPIKCMIRVCPGKKLRKNNDQRLVLGNWFRETHTIKGKRLTCAFKSDSPAHSGFYTISWLICAHAHIYIFIYIKTRGTSHLFWHSKTCLVKLTFNPLGFTKSNFMDSKKHIPQIPPNLFQVTTWHSPHNLLARPR